MLQIPVAAVQIDQAGRYVLVVDNENKVEVRRVEIDRIYRGQHRHHQVAWTKARRVIIEGIQKVRPQQVVEPTEATGQAPTS